MDTPYLSSAQAARRVGLSKATFLRAVLRDEITPALRTPGGCQRFRVADVDAYAHHLSARQHPRGAGRPRHSAATVARPEGSADGGNAVGGDPGARDAVPRHTDWLLGTMTGLVRCHTVAHLLDLAYDAIRTGLGYDRVGIELIDPVRQALVDYIGTDDAGHKFYPRDRQSPLDGASYSLRVLTDPRMRSEGPGFIYLTDARREVPADGQAVLDGRPTEQLLVALRMAETVVGFIAVDNLTSGRPLPVSGAPLLIAFAIGLAAAVGNVHLLEGRARAIDALHADLQRRMAELEWLREVSRRITEARTRAEILEIVYGSIREGLGYDRAGINLFDHEAGVFEDCIGTDAQGRTVRPMDRTVELASDSPLWRFPGIAALLRGAEFYYTADAGAECPPELRYLFDGVPTHNLMIPLRAGDRVSGIISVDNLVSGRPISPAEAAPLLALAHQVGTAVENARLHEREQAERRERAAAAERLRTVYATMACGVIVRDAAGLIVDANEAAQEILGQPMDRLRGQALAATLTDTAAADGTPLPPEERPVAVAFRTGRPQRGYLMTATCADGQRRWLQVDAVPTLDPDGAPAQVVVSFVDITARKQAEETLRHQACHDPLTALANRTLFLDRLEQALAHTARSHGAVAVLFLDLDRFKVINDSLGHDAGDQLLVALAQRLTACVRGGDTVARLGGDEFAILLDEPVDATAAARLAARITQALAVPVRVGGHDVVTLTSIGIVTSTRGCAAAALMRDADVALYRAKAQGRGRYAVFDATMDARPLERLELEGELRVALERGEFTVYYQPKMELATGRLAGMEALVRWQSPTRGLVVPGVFIPLAEETGLIQPLGQWVLEEACRQTTRWNAGALDGAAIVVSVNLSARQFAHQTLVADVARALAESGVEPRHIQLEITESVAMGDAEATIQTLQRLKALGVQLAIDDFGTGYSSLAYLKRFPVDVLKIDRTFVSGLEHNSEDAAIVNAVISLGHALRLSVVAEGVETAEEAAQLHTMGCEIGQGYYFARPLPPEQADACVQHRPRAA